MKIQFAKNFSCLNNNFSRVGRHFTMEIVKIRASTNYIYVYDENVFFSFSSKKLSGVISG